MGQSVIADNWSLQDISRIFTGGLREEDTSVIEIHNNQHTYNSISYAIVQTEALFDFLTDIVLRDEIIVDAQFTNAWNEANSPISRAVDAGVLRSFPFLEDSEKLIKPRDQLVSQLCITSSLKNDHAENVRSYNTTQEATHKYLSAVLWGGAGMLARSFIYDCSYTPHPLRRKFFLNTGFLLPATDAVHIVNSLINDKRLSVSKSIYGQSSLHSMFVNLPPIPIRAIQDSSSALDIISNALQLREEFTELREWLRSFQEAISEDDSKKIMQYSKVLDSVTRNINHKLGLPANSTPKMSVGIGAVQLNIDGDLINSLHNKIGVKSTLNKLILDSSGKKALKKYSSFFGEGKSSIGLSLEQHFATYSG